MNPFIEYSGIRKSVLDFALDMEERLAKNDHKGGWKNIEIATLVNKVAREILELMQCIDEGKCSNLNPEDCDIVAISADIANFAMMIAEAAKYRASEGYNNK